MLIAPELGYMFFIWYDYIPFLSIYALGNSYNLV